MVSLILVWLVVYSGLGGNFLLFILYNFIVYGLSMINLRLEDVLNFELKGKIEKVRFVRYFKVGVVDYEDYIIFIVIDIEDMLNCY